MKLSALSLFSGAGGMDIGVELAGFKTHCSIECDPHCEPVILQAAKDWARISATAQKHVAKIARFRAKREKQNERIKKLLTELLGTGCPLDDCTGELIGQDREEDERYAEMIGACFEIRCTVCDAEMYPPPAMRLQQHGAEYFRAGRELLRSTKTQSVGMPTIFVLHQAAELYLKSLGNT